MIAIEQLSTMLSAAWPDMPDDEYETLTCEPIALEPIRCMKARF